MVGRHVDGHELLRAVPAIHGEFARQESQREAPLGVLDQDHRLNPDSLSGEKATTSCFTGA